MVPSSALLLTLTVTLSSLLIHGVNSKVCAKPGEFFINTGGPNLPGIIRCDTGAYASPGSQSYTAPFVPIGPGCIGYLFTHRFSKSGNLVYKIPVNPGSYTVNTYFMETWHNAVNKRVFNLLINGKAPAGGAKTDVFDAAKGKNKPLQRTAFNVVANAANGNHIYITLARSIGDPFISAISINGAGATAKVGSTGLGSCAATGGGGSPPASGGGTAPPPPTGGGGGGSSNGGGAFVPGNKLPCPGPKALFINAGGKPANGYRCDIALFSKSEKYVIPPAVNLGGACSSHMWSHGFTFGSQLNYNIKVPPGKHSYQLQFMETFFNAPNKRKFSVTVNGKVITPALDVIAGAGGKNKPFVISGTVTAGAAGINIKLGKIANFDNPFISGIAIWGANPTQSIGNQGLNSCNIGSGGVGGGGGGGGGSCATNFNVDHLAHAVSGGPYVETDFKGQKFATVFLDGTPSHSHASTQTVPGDITKFTWTWTDKGNFQANAQGVVTKTGGKVSAPFPIGTTKLKLTVTDNFGNCAEEITDVTVQAATKPGAYCYYYDYGNSQPNVVPLPFSALVGPKPTFATNVGDINFGNLASFGNFKFKGNSFAVRCVYQIDVKKAGFLAYDISHWGPIKAYQGNQLMAQSNGFGSKKTSTKGKFYPVGLHQWQLLYFHKEFSPAVLKLQFKNGGVVPASIVRHDASTTLPIITGISMNTGFTGQPISIFGLAFVNGVQIKFGSVPGQPFLSNAGTIELPVPQPKPGVAVVDIVVETAAGESNPVQFVYGGTPGFCDQPSWQTTSLKQGKGNFNIANIAVIKYGPDGRLYAGTQFNLIHAFSINQQLSVWKTCTLNVKGPFKRRWILGIAFNPKLLKPTMYFTTSTMFWNKKTYKITPFANGWQNGKVQAIDMLPGPNNCFDATKLRDVVVGLPVSNHDHGVNWLQFLPNGQLLISCSGTTNGGISVKNDLLGGIPASPLSGSIITCPPFAKTIIKYTIPGNPAATKANLGGCKIYAPGFRNSFGAELHTNGWLYAMDNGPNQGFGSFSTNCKGGQIPAKNTPDRFIKVQPGKCHGHPNLNRGNNGDSKQCLFRPKSCVGTLWNFKPSTNGVLEYRSNVFKMAFKTHVFLSRFSQAGNTKGTVARVILNDQGNIKGNGVNNVFFGDSGLSIAEGPRGEIIMSRVFKTSFVVYKPVCKGTLKGTYLIGVHPKRGSAFGGQNVVVSGFKFGNNPKAFFGSKPCPVVFVISTNAFVCKTPSGVPNTQVVVKVIDAAGNDNMQNTAGLGGDFWYW